MRAVLIALAITIAGRSVAGSQGPVTRTLSGQPFEFPQQFSEIGSIRELRDGRVIVVDARELTVQLLDPRRGSAARIGRTGDGPGEYRWPSRLFPLQGDSTLLDDTAGGRLMVILPDGKAGGFYDPNRAEGDSILARARRFFVHAGDGRGHLFGEAQPIRVGAGGVLELADHAAIVRFDVATRNRDTVALFPVRKDANARIIPRLGAVITQPRKQPFPAWDHWAAAPDGRIAFIFFEPYRVDFVAANRGVVQNAPIPYDRVRVDDALKKQYREERERPRMVMRGSTGGGASTMEMMKMPYTEPAEWPEYLPPYLETAVFGSDGLLWIPRATAAGKPPLYDIIDGQGRLVERVQFPSRTKLIGFGARSVYVVRLDEDDLQYLQRYSLPTTARP